MTASRRPELRSAATSTSTTAIGLIRALTDARPIKPTSTRCLSARRPNPGRGSTYRRGNPVQTTAATSQINDQFHANLPVLCITDTSTSDGKLNNSRPFGSDAGGSEGVVG